MNSAAPGRKIYVCGTSGSGKSTLAAELGRRRGVPHTEIDSLYHLPNWQPCPTEEFQAKVEAIIQTDGWAMDGNYRAVRDRVCEACDTLIWLDYPRGIVMWRVISRTVRRLLSREELWNGNRESFVSNFLTRESVIWWAWTTHHRRREDADRAMEEFNETGKILLRFRHPKETERWLATIPMRP